ncbi:DMT family transporter [Halorussus halophilus]|uniref:DMT family transporter n=1 Tax=Halorussus halophilus TaxID=2650975 RepID=UPI001300EBA3|nr:EamA family transporter [Halorussus halophilus]
MRDRTVAAMFLLLGLLWGSSFVTIDVGLEFFPPVLFAALRYYVAGLVVLGFAVWTTDRWRPRTRADWTVAVLVGALMIAGHHALLYIGQQYVSGPVAAVVISLSPLLTAVFSVFLLDERLTGLGVVGFALGLLGVSLVAQPNPDKILSANVRGIAIVFVAAAVFALGSVLTRPLESNLPARSVQAWGMLVGAPILHFASLARGETFAAIQWTPTATASLVYLALVCGAGAFLIYFELLDLLGPTEINLIGYLEPVAATLLSWVLLGQLVDPLTAAGFVVIFSGFACIKRRALADLVSGVRAELAS